MKDACIIIPVYNEEQVIRGVVTSVLEKYAHVVCVDDGSTDGSLHELEQTGAVVLKHPFNLGQGASLQTGIEYALSHTDCEYFVTFDADGQHDVANVDRLLRTLQEHALDIVLGSRFLPHEASVDGTPKSLRLPLLRKMMLKMAVLLTRLESGLKLTDTHNGLRAFTRRVAAELDIRAPGMAHASEIINTIAERGYSFQEVPVTIHYSEYARAKGQSMLNAINLFVDLLFKGSRRIR